MSVLSNLKYADGSRKKRKRVGRGPGSGYGKTSTRGHKGAGSRSGTKWHAWFEGGQMPIHRRLPKFGFKNPHRVKYQVLNLGDIQKFYDIGRLSATSLNPDVLFNEGIISQKKLPVKILGDGEIKQKLEITAHKFSKSALDKIEKSGGKVIIL